MMFYKEKEFKEEPFVGKIPVDWDVTRLGEESISEIVMGQSPPSSTYNKEGIGLPFLQGKMDFGDIYPKLLVYCSEPVKIAQPDDILFSVRAPVGDVNLAPCKLCIGRGLAAIRFNNEIANHLFYFYYFQRIRKHLEALGKGSTFKAINKDDLENLIIPIPSLGEQRKIVGVLGVVDSVIAKTGEVIWKTERLKKGLMQTLLTRGIGHKEYKQTPIGTIPKEWEINKVSDLFDVVTGTTPSTRQSEYWNDGTVNWLTPTDLSKLNGKIHIKNSERKITERALKETNLTLMPKGSIIISTRAPVGYVAVLEEPATFNQGCKGLIPKKHDGILSEFYCYYLLNKKQMLENLSSGSTFKELSKERLQNFNIPSPSFTEQKKIAELLLTIDKKINIERSEKVRLEQIKRGLMDLLLTGKIRVKVD
ncbi:MAG: restriction endonuclease subunit S [Candidatus Bathyarchaeales archaeon]